MKSVSWWGAFQFKKEANDRRARGEAADLRWHVSPFQGRPRGKEEHPGTRSGLRQLRFGSVAGLLFILKDGGK